MIILKDLTKVFELNKNNKTVAVNSVNLEIKESELIVLKGASGSGKSTILSLIAGLSKPTTGEVVIGENRVSKLPDNFASLFRRENIGFIFQKYNLIPTLSVSENILVPLIPQNPSNLEAKEILKRVMKKFKIEHKKDEIVKNLSGGEQQRVAIARSQVNNPNIIIADEPTANLDKELSLHFIEILRELKNDGKTIIVATHDPLFFDLDFVDRVIEVSNGEIL
ncbi:ABC transporter ATP-binding protein [Halarcobacter ebronensis]|uniref:ABC transporter ATP-binding protein n=1 Tax=Halarcobacter ebronensis TaxID=1462615 RepID=A0A4Q1AQ44_9BACT|nr:ABC transporter ATP-binding protein [Halarcobacter ebronensis]QKF82798.1 ABC transporter, ATP-binding protein, FtsE/LolD family [Halarcobacter ebronensis]RXK06822.1 ABC transporter ATP-binding protein [Halarcobacter ebronensis]